jgi:hypothetical protein
VDGKYCHPDDDEKYAFPVVFHHMIDRGPRTLEKFKVLGARNINQCDPRCNQNVVIE